MIGKRIVFGALTAFGLAALGLAGCSSEAGDKTASSMSAQGEATDVALAQQPVEYGQRREEVIALIEEIGAAGNTLSGQQVNEYEIFIECDSFDYIREMTGETPAVLGIELMFAMEYAGYEDLMMEHVEEQAARGGLVTVTWHARNPLVVCPRGEYYECSQYPMTDEELARMLEPGTREHELWLADLDATAEILKPYGEKGITLLFRPFHEMNGGWFWWGQKEAYADLWAMTYDRLTNHHGIENMIWVWGADKAAEGAAQYYPGDGTVDFAGTDYYAASTDDTMFMTGFDNVGSLNESGFAITEVGIMPNYEIFQQLSPLWFLQWGGSFMYPDWDYAGNCDRCSPEGHVAEVYSWPEVLSVSEMPVTDRMRAAIDMGARDAVAAKECPLSLL